MEPGAISFGALDDVATYTFPDDPYPALLARDGARDAASTPRDVAVAVADAAASTVLPLRVPIGESAKKILDARHNAPDDVPFVPGG